MRLAPSGILIDIDLHRFLEEVDNHDPMKVMLSILKSDCVLRPNDGSSELGVISHNILPVSMLFNLRSTALNSKVKIAKKEDRTLFITPEITLEVIGSPKYEIS